MKESSPPKSPAYLRREFLFFVHQSPRWTIIKRGGGVRDSIIEQTNEEGWSRKVEAHIYYYSEAARAVRLRLRIANGHSVELSFHESERRDLIPRILQGLNGDKNSVAEVNAVSNGKDQWGGEVSGYWWSQKGSEKMDERNREVEAMRRRRAQL